MRNHSHRADFVDAGDLIQTGNVGSVISHHAPEGPSNLFDLSLEILNGLQQQGKKIGMMVGEKSLD